MKKYIQTSMAVMLLVIISNSSTAASIGQITGKVTDKETQTPVAYALITFENSMGKVEVEANEYGLYYGNHIPTGKYQMRISFNNRTFVVKNVRIYDGYATELNFLVSSNENLPALVEVEKTDVMLSNVQPTDIMLSNSSNLQATRSLSDVLSMQPGVDVRNGQLTIKGSSSVKFFIDGSPTMAPAHIERIW